MSSKASRPKASWRYGVTLAAMAAAGAFLVHATFVPEESGGPEGKGRSASGQAQSGAVGGKEAGAPMPGAKELLKEGAPLPKIVRDLKVKHMDELLKAPPEVTAGEQPSLEQARGLKSSGGGGQKEQRLQRVAAPAKSHLKLLLKINEDGSFEVLSAAEVPGEAVVSEEALSDFVVEVTDGTQTIGTESLPGDPFEEHGFGGPKGATEGHFFGHQKEAVVAVTVPGLKLDSPFGGVNLRVYKFKEGAPVPKVNAEALRKLKSENRLQTLVHAPGDRLAPQIQKRGFKVPFAPGPN